MRLAIAAAVLLAACGGPVEVPPPDMAGVDMTPFDCVNYEPCKETAAQLTVCCALDPPGTVAQVCDALAMRPQTNAQEYCDLIASSNCQAIQLFVRQGGGCCCPQKGQVCDAQGACHF